MGCYKRIALRKRFLFTTKWGSITAKINWSGRRESNPRIELGKLSLVHLNIVHIFVPDSVIL